MNYHSLRDKFGKFRPATRREKAEKKPTTTRKRATLKPVKKKHILNVFLLDNTGSMYYKRGATAQGFNKVVADAALTGKEVGVQSTESLILFGELGYFEIQDKVKPLGVVSAWGGPLAQGHQLYNPDRPRTAIWWSVKRAIEHTTMQLEIMPKDTKVLLTIFTDGENNEGGEYETEARKLVEAKQQEGWVINFIGAGEKQYIEKMSGKIGIFASNTLNFMDTSVGTTTAFDTFRKATRKYAASVATNSAKTDGFFSKN